jgi:hypothetical protein
LYSVGKVPLAEGEKLMVRMRNPSKLKKQDSNAAGKETSELRQMLNTLRLNLASANNVGLSLVCSDISLGQMCEQLPQSVDHLSFLDGWVEGRVQRYGTAFLDAIAKYLKEGAANAIAGAGKVDYDKLIDHRNISDVEYYLVERCKTDRAQCKKCKTKIDLGMKISVKYRSMQYGIAMHLGCAAQHYSIVAGKNLRGMEILSPDEKVMIEGMFREKFFKRCSHCAHDRNKVDFSFCQKCGGSLNKN